MFSNYQSSIRDSIRRLGAFPQAVGVADAEREAQIGARWLVNSFSLTRAQPVDENAFATL